MSNASLTDYKGLSVLATTPTGAGGQAINDNFKKLADRMAYLSDRDPRVSDVTDSSPNGFAFVLGSRWINTNTGAEWVCTGNTPPGQQPAGLVWQQVGSHFESEIAALSTSLAAKAPCASPSFTGDITMGANASDAVKLQQYGAPKYLQLEDGCGTASWQAYGSINLKTTSAGATIPFSFVPATSTVTSGMVSVVAITPTYDQVSSTANNTDLLINRTQTAVGSGTQNLVDLQVAGVSKFRVDTTGNVNAAAQIHSGYNGNSYLQGSYLAFYPSGSGPPASIGASGTDTVMVFGTATSTATSGTRYAYTCNTSYNQTSGTASNTDLLISRTQAAVGSGAQNLIDCQVNGVSKASISASGWLNGYGFCFATNTNLKVREAYGFRFFGQSDGSHPVQVADVSLLVGIQANGEDWGVGHIVQNSNTYHYFGSPNTDGSIRIGMGTGANAGKLIKQIRSNGSWGTETAIA